MGHFCEKFSVLQVLPSQDVFGRRNVGKGQPEALRLFEYLPLVALGQPGKHQGVQFLGVGRPANAVVKLGVG